MLPILPIIPILPRVPRVSGKDSMINVSCFIVKVFFLEFVMCSCIDHKSVSFFNLLNFFEEYEEKVEGHNLNLYTATLQCVAWWSKISKEEIFQIHDYKMFQILDKSRKKKSMVPDADPPVLRFQCNPGGASIMNKIAQPV